jgi:cytochrome c553
MRGERGIATAAAALGITVVLASGAGEVGAQQRKPGESAPAPRAAASAPAAAPSKGVYAERFAGLCAACHGANGRSDMPATPALAGQHSFYAITQLFLFREGRRNNEAMIAVAKTLKDDDLRGFSDFIGTLPPVPPPAPAPPDAAIMSKGQVLARQHKCVFCHGDDLAGGQQVPRIGGQREDYLLTSLKGFKDGTRPGYTQAMSEAMSQVPAADIEPLAYYIARMGPAPGTK